MTYCAQVTVGSGKPSASQANIAEVPMSAVALTSDCLARMVGRTEKEMIETDARYVMSAHNEYIMSLKRLHPDI